MADFCECGSLVIDGRCTNKSCSLRTAAKDLPVKKAASRAKAQSKTPGAVKPVKAANPRRASKCITYNLYDKTEENDDGALT